MTTQDWNNANNEYDDCISNGQDPSFCESYVQSAYPDFTPGGSGGGGGGSALADYWNNPNNWIGFTGGLTDIIGNIVGMANGQPNQYAQYQQQQQQQQQQNSTMWWIIGAVAILFLILLLVLIFRK